MKPPGPSPAEGAPTRSALLLCEDSLAAALLGGLLETIGWQPLFAEPNEPPREALRRLRPTVVLADCGYDAAWAGTFLGPARMLGVPVVVLGAMQSTDEARQLAARHRVPSVLLPIEADALERCLDEALARR